MKTLLLSADDIQNFGKLIYDPKTAQLVTAAQQQQQTVVVGVNNNNNNNNNNNTNSNFNINNNNHSGSGSNLMALQYYLKHPSNYPAAAAATTASAGVTGNSTQQATLTTSQQQHHQQQQQQQLQLQRPQATSAAHQQLLAQSQTQLKQLQLKQPTIHATQHAAYHHRHPYYPQQQQQQTTLNASAAGHHTHLHAHAHTHHSAAPPPVPVHALNQNSNFSAASSSTGGGTASSHAPTQQSNTTGSSLSPPGATASARNTNANASNNAAATSNSAANAQAQIRNGGASASGGSAASATKKLKTEPILSQFHQTERLTFANTHIVWGEEHWRRVVFQDERKFNLDGPDGFSYYFHDLRNTERALSQRPRGNSVYIYVLISAGGAIHLDVSTAKQRPETCIEMILRERANIVSKLGGSGNNSSDFILQDHNWSANALPTANEWLAAEGIKTQKWPTIAHDLNIMENVWGWLIREVFDGGRKFSRKDDLIFRIREAWARLPVDLVANLYSTLPERVTELYYTRGVYTNC